MYECYCCSVVCKHLLTMEDTGDEPLKKVTQSIESFMVDFYMKTADKIKGNFVSSALSAYIVLTMAAYGARGNTGVQMKKALHLPDNDSEACEGFQSYIDTLNNIENVILKLANKIYVRDDRNVKQDFLNIIENYFRSKVEMMDATKAIETAKVINQWCEESTNGKINDVLTAGDITDDLLLILLNTAYFKGSWKHTFSEEMTKPARFYIRKLFTIKVPTMVIREDFAYRTVDELDAQCIKLPYKNEDLEMEIILPNKVDGLAFIEKNLEKLNDNMRYERYKLSVSLPKFKIETNINLNESFNEMGMDEMFSNLANFQGIADSPLKVSKVQQKAFIEVNEEGSEGGVCNRMFLVQYCLNSDPEYFIVNKPFLFRIIYKTSTIFIGRVTNPLSDTDGSANTPSLFNKLIFCK